MDRRAFMKGAGAQAGLAGLTTLAATNAFADGPTVRWRLASSFPKNLDTIYGAAEQVAQRIHAATQGKFQIRPYAAGEIVPGLQVLDAVQKGTVECGHSASYYYIGKNSALAFDCVMPFGLTARQQNAWMYAGGGNQLMADLFKRHHVVSLPCGNTGVQMGGWFRREIHSLADLKGLKMRIPGMGGQIMARLGVIPQTLAGSDVYPSLERGTLDAAEWVGPYDDEKLGFQRVTKHYYYPGWWEGGPQLSIYVNLDKWNALPEHYQTLFTMACAEANVQMLAEYDAKNPAALARLIKQGVKLHAYPKDILDAARSAAFELYAQEAAKNPDFARIYEAWKVFRSHEIAWFKIAEGSYSNYINGVK